MTALSLKKQAHLKRKKSIRKTLKGTTQRPRLSVFRSARHIYAQVIDDTIGHTIVAASSLDQQIKEHLQSQSTIKKAEVAVFVGKLIAQRAIEKGIQKVVFDRNGFLYHGRVKAVSDGAREAGLQF